MKYIKIVNGAKIMADFFAFGTRLLKKEKGEIRTATELPRRAAAGLSEPV